MELALPTARRALRERRARWLRAAVILGPMALALAIPLACATKDSPLGPGEECFAASDCQAGLVCIPQRNGARVCSSDLTQVTGRPPPEAGAADSTPVDAPADGPPTPEDSGGPNDTGTTQDTGITDTGTGG